MFRVLKWLILACVLMAGAAGAAMAAVVWWYSRDLPDHEVLRAYEPSVLTRVHAADGTAVAVFARENRVFTPVEEIPALVRRAFISAEDKNFYENPGVDPGGILKAVVRNIRNYATGRRLQGASTITQQVAKNMLLSRETTLIRKIREGILAVRLGRALGKDRILELYLNEIFLGERAYGVAAASLRYFGKSLDDLVLHEAAYLAALPKGPNNYHPVRHPERALERRRYVLFRMAEDGHVTHEEAEAASERSLGTLLAGEATHHPVFGGYFVEEVRREMQREFGADQLYEGGLSIRTTMSPELQALAGRSLRGALEQFDRQRGYAGPLGRIEEINSLSFGTLQERLGAIDVPRDITGWRLAAVLETDGEGARIGVEGFGPEQVHRLQFDGADWARRRRPEGGLGPPPATPGDVWSPGDVVLVSEADVPEPEDSTRVRYWTLRQIPEVQGALLAMDPHTGRVLAMQGGFSYEASSFNRATQALRQPGSVFKPVVYAAALDGGYTPATRVLDAPLRLEQGPGLEKWEPENANQDVFAGPAPLRRGIEESRNLMTVRVAQDVGLDRVAEYARRLGVYEDMPPLLSYALGAGETTLENLVRAYAVFASGGKRVEPVLVDRVQDRRGNTIYRRDDRPCVGCAANDWIGQEEPYIPGEGTEVLDPVTAFQITWMLQGVVERGSGRAAGVPGRIIAGKTGTTNDSRDVWFVGYTPEVVVGCYIGYDEPRSLGVAAFGGRLCAPVVGAFIGGLPATASIARFARPSGLEFAPVEHETGIRVESAGELSAGIIEEAFRSGSVPPVGKFESASHMRSGTGGLY